MKRRLTEDEFRQLMEPWDAKMKAIAEERLASGYRTQAFKHFSEAEAATMRAALGRLIPHGEDIDLVGFIDSRLQDSLGRGDRRPGMPEEQEVIRIGLAGLDEASSTKYEKAFADLDGPEQDEVLREVQSGQVEGPAWRGVPSDYFFQRFYARALTGYFAHPKAWMRIGFYGPSYPEGYVWLNKGSVKQRHERAAGWDRL